MAEVDEVIKRASSNIKGRDVLSERRGTEGRQVFIHEPAASVYQQERRNSKKAGADQGRHRRGSGWQTRDRETLPSRTAKK